MAIFFDNDCLTAIGIDTAPRHLDNRGRPLCGRDPEGEEVVDEPVHVTCTACLLEIGNRLQRAEGAS